MILIGNILMWKGVRQYAVYFLLRRNGGNVHVHGYARALPCAPTAAVSFQGALKRR